MNNYKERKKISLVVIGTLFIIILALIAFVTMLFFYIKREKQENEMQEYFGTYELKINNFFEYGEDIIPYSNIVIEKDNTTHFENKMITSSNINFIKINNEGALLIYFNLLASTTSQEESRIDELGLTKICLIKEKNKLKQIDCPNMINDQNLGSSIKNVNLEYKKIES